jgi:hypothetical protein
MMDLNLNNLEIYPRYTRDIPMKSHIWRYQAGSQHRHIRFAQLDIHGLPKKKWGWPKNGKIWQDMARWNTMMI